MTKLEEYVSASKSFEGGEQFAQLLTDGMALVGLSHRQFAAEIQVIPSTVSRWASGATKPLTGMQKLAISKLRKRASKAAEAQKPVTKPEETRSRSYGPSGFSGSPSVAWAAKGK